MTLLTQLLTTLNAKINEVKNEIPSITNLSSNTALNAKINDVKNKVPNITKLAKTTNAGNSIEIKIPDHIKYTITPKFNELTAEGFTARLKYQIQQLKLILLDC